MKSLRAYPLTWLASFVVLGAVIFGQVTEKKWENSFNGVFAADVKGYYAYLPAFFIHDDIHLQNREAYISEHGLMVWYIDNDDGQRYIKYTCGTAIAYTPFFLTAHFLAESLGYPADGFSLPYAFALAMSSIFYLLIALIFLSKILLRYFSDHVTAASILVLFIGTNALHYYTGNMTYSHGYSLAIIAAFLYYTIRWIEAPNWKFALAVGLFGGWMILIRPVDILFLLALPLFGLESFSAIKTRFLLFFTKWKHVLLMLAMALLVFSPQLIYNYTVFGSLAQYSYGKEAFYFSNPQILDSLFSYRNGWLVYSPLMVLSLAGLFVLGKYRMKFGAFLIPTVILYIYVISSWWCWWYVGFGNRAYINLYPLLALSLAACIHYLYAQHWFKRTVLNLMLLGGLIFSAFQTHQYERWTIHWGAMTENAYTNALWRTDPSQVFDTLLRYPVDHLVSQGIDAVYEPTQYDVFHRYLSFNEKALCDTSFQALWSNEHPRYGKGGLKITEGMEFPGRPVPISIKGFDAVYISAWVHKIPNGFNLTLSCTEPVSFYRASYDVCAKDGDWSKVHLFTWLPADLGTDSLSFAIWNIEKKPFYLDDLTIRGIKFDYREKIR